VAEAEKDQAIGMKQAERDSSVQVAALRAEAISGENQAETQGVLHSSSCGQHNVVHSGRV